MADFLLFDEGAGELLASGLPATCYFLLSTKSVDGTSPFAASDVIGTGDGEITGTGYARESQSEPAIGGDRDADFALMSWATGAATDWPADVRSVVLVTSSDDTGKMVCAWNLQTGGAARDMSGANTTENVTPTLAL